MNNLKQLGLAFAQYTQDYDGGFPQARLAAPFTWEWQNSIYPYHKNAQIYRCPSDQVEDIDLTNLTLWTDTATKKLRSAVSYLYPTYLGNVNFMPGPGAAYPFLPTYESDIRAPVSAALLIEGIRSAQSRFGTGTDFAGRSQSLYCAPYQIGYYNNDAERLIDYPQLYTPSTRYGLPRHVAGSGSNVLYIDTHVKFAHYTNAKELNTALPYCPTFNGGPSCSGCWTDPLTGYCPQ